MADRSTHSVTLQLVTCEDSLDPFHAGLAVFIDEQRARGYVVTEVAVGKEKSATGLDGVLPAPPAPPAPKAKATKSKK